MLIFPQNDFDFGKAAGVYIRCSRLCQRSLLPITSYSSREPDQFGLQTAFRYALVWGHQCHIYLASLLWGIISLKQELRNRTANITRSTGRIFTTIEMREDKKKVNQNSATKSPENREDRPMQSTNQTKHTVFQQCPKKNTTHHPIMSLSARAQLWHFRESAL